MLIIIILSVLVSIGMYLIIIDDTLTVGDIKLDSCALGWGIVIGIVFFVIMWGIRTLHLTSVVVS